VFSIAAHCPHVSNCSSSKDTCTMLVSGPSLPVLWYLWSSSRFREPLLRHWQFRPRQLATNPLPLSTWRYGAMHRNMCTRRWDIWIPLRPPGYTLRHLRSIRGVRRFSRLSIIAVTAKAMPGDKDCRTPWRNSLGRVDLWRRLNFLLYPARECHVL
jgi:hypothetical protein